MNWYERDPLFEQLLGFVNSALADFPGTFELETGEFPSNEVPYFYIRVVPHGTTSAPILLQSWPDGIKVDVWVGQDTWYELPLEGTWGELRHRPMHEEAPAVIHAVAHGRFRERLLRAGERICESHGFVVIDGQEYASSSYHGVQRDPRAQWEETDYQPYDSGG